MYTSPSFFVRTLQPSGTAAQLGSAQLIFIFYLFLFFCSILSSFLAPYCTTGGSEEEKMGREVAKEKSVKNERDRERRSTEERTPIDMFFAQGVAGFLS